MKFGAPGFDSFLNTLTMQWRWYLCLILDDWIYSPVCSKDLEFNRKSRDLQVFKYLRKTTIGTFVFTRQGWPILQFYFYFWTESGFFQVPWGSCVHHQDISTCPIIYILNNIFAVINVSPNWKHALKLLILYIVRTIWKSRKSSSLFPNRLQSGVGVVYIWVWANN